MPRRAQESKSTFVNKFVPFVRFRGLGELSPVDNLTRGSVVSETFNQRLGTVVCALAHISQGLRLGYFELLDRISSGMHPFRL
jgi:hypothetical protein